MLMYNYILIIKITKYVYINYKLIKKIIFTIILYKKDIN
jgi:hypothetical protein